MNTSKNKTKIIIFILILAIGIAVFYFFYFKKNAGVVVVPTDENPVTFTIGNQNITPNQTPGTQSVQVLSGGERIVTGTGPIPVLRKITTNPVAGITFKKILKNKEDKTLVRFIEKITGHIFEVENDSWVIDRISNTTIPKIHEAIWEKDAESIYIRHILEDSEGIQTYYAKLKPATTTTAQGIPEGTEENFVIDENFKLEGIYLAKDIQELYIGNNGKKILYMNRDNIGSRGIIADPDGLKPSEILNSPLREITLSWPKEQIITLTTKPSAGAFGFLYFLNKDTKGLQKILGNIIGLTTLTNPTAELVLYGESGAGNYNLRLYDVKEKENLPISLSTLPEKCVWSTLNLAVLYCAVPVAFGSGPYPDSWYKGQVSFNDEIWKINIETGENNLLAKLKELSGEEIDGIKLSLSPEEDHLLFINKKDSSLWDLRLVEKSASSTPSGE